MERKFVRWTQEGIEGIDIGIDKKGFGDTVQNSLRELEYAFVRLQVD